MRLPFVSSIRELESAPRRFLYFTAFNVISWQCIAGAALVLLARKIEMPESLVGFLISFMPLSMVLVVFMPELVTRLGPKRIMSSTWLMRNLISCAIFALPWAINHGGQKAGWAVVLAVTLAFCVIRAGGAGGWFPWIHEVVPPNQRGLYFSSEASVGQLINVAVLVGQSAVLLGTPDVTRYLWIYAAGIIAGLISLIWMWRVPGGLGVREPSRVKGRFDTYRVVLADRPFLGFVLTASLALTCLSWLSSASVMFMRDALKLPSGVILLYISLGSAGILATIRFWQRYAEHSGSGLTMFKTLTAHSLAALLLLALIPGVAWSRFGIAPVLVVTSIFNASFGVAMNRALLNYFNPDERVAYTTVWVVCANVALGITPILAGVIIQTFGLWGYRTCFALAGITGLACALACRRVVQDGAPTPMSNGKFDPAAPLRTLARIARITIGLHESNR